jgi:hypothetical protein
MAQTHAGTHAGPSPVSRPRCRPSPGVHCTGAPFPPFDRCLEHLSGTEIDQAFGLLNPGTDIDVRGTRLSGKLLSRLTTAVSNAAGEAVFGTAEFGGAQFDDTASFEKARFNGDARFESAVFHADATFTEALFTQNALFTSTQFEGAALFGSGVTVNGSAEFSGVQFHGPADFTHATFAGGSSFRRATFSGAADFTSTRCHANADFTSTRFSTAKSLGPLAVRDRLLLDQMIFDERATIKAAASAISARHASFAGATLRLGYADVSLDNISSTEPVTVIGASAEFAASAPSSPGTAPYGGPDPEPALLSLVGVDASQLLLIDLDLSECRFTGAFNLDQLRFEGSRCRFAEPPKPRSWRHALPPTKRQMLAEERDWRSGRRRFAWQPRRHPSVPALEPERILTIYRQLRKAQEDAKNEPGAADFYYGEMEMRRHASTTPAAEKLILTLYWAVSGYGLRATRALWALLITLTLSTAAFATIGFAPSQTLRYQPVPPSHPGLAAAYQQVADPGPRPGWLNALFYSLHSSTSLLSQTQPAPVLTNAGEAVQIALKLLGPIFAGLAILAVRNRIKR